MAQNWTWIIVLIAILLVGGMLVQKNYELFATGNEVLSRIAPSTVNPGSIFIVTYTPSGTSGKYFVAFEETITGCTPTSYKSFIGSEEGVPETKQVTFTAPSSGSCTFDGFYQFAEAIKVNFPQLVVNVCQPATCSSLGKNCGTWSDGCGNDLACGTCGDGKVCQTGICITCKTQADTNCDTIVTFTELIDYANKWVSGQVTFDDLLQAANAWVSN